MLRARRNFSWKLIKKAEHTDFKIISDIYIHEKLGSKLIHLKTQDQHRAFGLLFRTKSHDDKGTSHALERLCLCGSQNFPIKDQISKMTSRSLNSFTSS